MPRLAGLGRWPPGGKYVATWGLSARLSPGRAGRPWRPGGPSGRLVRLPGVGAPPPGRWATASLVVQCIQRKTVPYPVVHRPAPAGSTAAPGVRSGRWFHLAAVAAAEQVAALASCVLVPALAGYEGHRSTPAKRREPLGTHACAGGFQSGSSATKAGKSNSSVPVLLAVGDVTEAHRARDNAGQRGDQHGTGPLPRLVTDLAPVLRKETCHFRKRLGSYVAMLDMSEPFFSVHER